MPLPGMSSRWNMDLVGALDPKMPNDPPTQMELPLPNDLHLSFPLPPADELPFVDEFPSINDLPIMNELPAKDDLLPMDDLPPMDNLPRLDNLLAMDDLPFNFMDEPFDEPSQTDILSQERTSSAANNSDPTTGNLDSPPVRNQDQAATATPLPSAADGAHNPTEGGTDSQVEVSSPNWENVSAEEIMAKAGPAKSLNAYEKSWLNMGKFLKKDLGVYEPSEDDYIRYINFMRVAKKFKWSSIWSIFSRLKNCHQRRFASDVGQNKRITMLIQTYEAGYVRKTSDVFTRSQVEQILQLDLHCPKWVVWKAIAVVGFCGALRCCELRSIELGNIKTDDEGLWITFFHGKQRGEGKKNEFIVPFNRSEPHICMASRLIHYMNKLRESIPTLGDEDALFRRPIKKGYMNKPIGRNQLGKIPRLMATELGLKSPEKYLGHSFR